MGHLVAGHSCQRLSGHWVVWNLSDETQGGYARATVTLPACRKTLPFGWTTGVRVLGEHLHRPQHVHCQTETQLASL
jgi:hypothetical protein